MTTTAPFWTIDPALVQLALLTVARLSGVLFLTPPFNHQVLPVQVRLGLALALSMLVWRSLAAHPPAMATSVAGLIGLSASELVVGLTLGFAARMLIATASFAAELVGMQMGFGLASLFDPMLGAQVTVLTRLYDWTMLALFLALDAHQLVVGAVLESFRVLPPGGVIVSAGSVASLIPLSGHMFTVALALVAPTLGVIFLTNLVLVLASRAVPQLNLMSVGWPIILLLGLAVLMGNLDLMSGMVAGEMRGLQHVLFGLIRSFGHGG